MFHYMSEKCKSPILYTDRVMLFNQLAKGLNDRGVRFGCRAAGHEPRLLESTQIAMVQTEISRVTNGQRTAHNADVVFIDEAHKNSGPTMQGLVQEHRKLNPDCTVLGFTATPLGIGHFYKKLIVAGTNSELRKCGAHIPAHHYGPDEPDTKWISKVKIDDGECGIPNKQRMAYAQRVFGRVIDNYHRLNPEHRPAVLFAPGVPESLWFAQHLSANGISAAHIDGENVWVDGEQVIKTQEIVDDIRDRCESGDIQIVCNRFVLREGIDWPFLYHGIFATIFGSLTSYIQAGGRLLRSHPSLNHVVIQDHGGNWHRHGSLNANREWSLDQTNALVSSLRMDRLREKQEPEPIQCPKCNAVRMSGPICHECKYQHTTKSRMVLQQDGSLREMKGDVYRKRRRARVNDEGTQQEWIARVRSTQNSKKPHVRSRSLAQIEVAFARDHDWTYPNREWAYMPIQPTDWFRPVCDVKEFTQAKRC